MRSYGFWRTDKPKEPGFSHELISSDFSKIKHLTNMDELKSLPAPGIDTLPKAFEANVNRLPDHPFLGTRNGNHYEWMTFKEVKRQVDNFASGMQKLNLVPDVMHDGDKWRFMGIQAKNRKEWSIVHLANMYNKATTIALYDTLGAEAVRFVVNQTELTSISCSQEFVEKFASYVLNEANSDDKKMFRLKNLVSFEKVLDKDVLKKVEEAGLTLYSMDEVMAAGIDHMPNFTPIQAAYEDCFMFSYTSGTTGDPKGVMLTHKMVVNCVASLNLRLDGIQG